MSDDAFAQEARRVIGEKVAELKLLQYQEALELPGALAEDIEIDGNQVQLTVFRQSDVESLPNSVLVTAQLAKPGVGGLVSYHYEKGLVFSESGEIREATNHELLSSGG